MGAPTFPRMQISGAGSPLTEKNLRRLWSSPSRKHSNIVQRHLSDPTYGRRAVMDCPQGVPAIGDSVAARNPEVDGAAFTATYNERIPGELYSVRTASVSNGNRQILQRKPPCLLWAKSGHRN